LYAPPVQLSTHVMTLNFPYPALVVGVEYIGATEGAIFFLGGQRTPFTMASLERITCIPELLVNLMSFMDITTLSRFKLACKSYYYTSRDLWSIESLFLRFVDEPHGLLHVMRSSGAFVAGGLATQYMGRVVWNESDMDIFVRGRHSFLLKGYVLGCGYREVDNVSVEHEEGEDDRYEEFLARVGRVSSYEKGSKKIQIISTFDEPGRAIVQNFYSTVVVCVITCEASYCVYPKATFVDMDMYPLEFVTEHEKVQAEKYERRGWTKSDIVGGDEVFGARSFGDELTWCIPHWKDSKRELLDVNLRKLRFSPGEKRMKMLRDVSGSDWRW
jgi:hypothetical protein